MWSKGKQTKTTLPPSLKYPKAPQQIAKNLNIEHLENLGNSLQISTLSSNRRGLLPPLQVATWNEIVAKI